MRSRWVPTAAALVAVGWIAMSGVAVAHDELVSSIPIDGQSVDSPPASVELEFAGAIQSLGGGTAVVVTTAGVSGPEVVSVGDAEVDGVFVRQAVRPDLPDGEYLVSYRVISSDGHEVEGSTRFFVGPVPAEVSTTPPGAPFGFDEAAEDGDDGGIPGGLALGAGVLVVAVVAGLVVWRLRGRPDQS